MANVSAEPTLLSRLVRAGSKPLNTLAGRLFGPAKPRFMRASSRITEGGATVEAETEDNGNTRLTVRIKSLAAASKFAPGATVYVVWIQTRDGAKQNVGALVLSAEREGKLATVTPYRKFQVTVTPEVSGQTEQPTQEWIFTADVDRPDPRPVSYI